MSLVEDILATLPNSQVETVRVGHHWTAVVLETDQGRKCGLASTLGGGDGHHKGPDVPNAGELERHSAIELAHLIRSPRPVEMSIGAAAINALMPTHEWNGKDINAVDVLAELGDGKTVAVVGRFPFTEKLRVRVGELIVLEQEPQPDEHPASAAPEIFHISDVIAITGMTFINNSLEELLNSCPASAFVMVLGPSTPLHPLLFDYGAEILSGALVEDIEAVLHVLSQGGNFRQLHQVGIRLVSLRRDDFLA